MRRLSIQSFTQFMAIVILITLSALWETQAAACLEQSVKVRNGKTTAAWCGTIQSEKRCEASYTVQKSKRYQCYWEGTSCFTPELIADNECPTTTAITTSASTTTTTTLKTTETTTTRTTTSTTTSVSTTTSSVSSSSTASTSTSPTIPSTTPSTSTSSSSTTSTVVSTSIKVVSSSSSASRTIATTSLNAITSSAEITSSRQVEVSTTVTTSPSTRTTTIDTTLSPSTEKLTTTSNNTSAIATIGATTTTATVTESFDATTSTAKTSSFSFRMSVSTGNAAASTAPIFAAAPTSAQLSRENIIVLVVGGGVLFCVLSVIVFIVCVCRKRDKRKDEYDSSSQDSTPGLTIYTDPSQVVRPNLPIDDYNNSPLAMPPVEDKTTHIIQVAEEYDDSPYPSTNEYNSDED